MEDDINDLNCAALLNGSAGARTRDHRIKSPVLYQLSYRPQVIKVTHFSRTSQPAVFPRCQARYSPGLLRGQLEQAGRYVREMLTEARRTISWLPLRLTETGSSDPAQQLACWRGTIEGKAAEKLAARVDPYCLQTDPNHPEHGLREPVGTERPTLTWLKERAAGVTL
jgi:hypothetical protein